MAGFTSQSCLARRGVRQGPPVPLPRLLVLPGLAPSCRAQDRLGSSILLPALHANCCSAIGWLGSTGASFPRQHLPGQGGGEAGGGYRVEVPIGVQGAWTHESPPREGGDAPTVQGCEWVQGRRRRVMAGEDEEGGTGGNARSWGGKGRGDVAGGAGRRDPGRNQCCGEQAGEASQEPRGGLRCTFLHPPLPPSSPSSLCLPGSSLHHYVDKQSEESWQPRRLSHGLVTQRPAGDHLPPGGAGRPPAPPPLPTRRRRPVAVAPWVSSGQLISPSKGTLQGTFAGHFWFAPSPVGQRSWCSSSFPILIWALGFFGPLWPEKAKGKLQMELSKSLDT